MGITIISTDAALTPRGAAWAAVIRRDGSTTRLSGRLRATDIQDAELAAVHRALSATGASERVSLILDNTSVIAWLRGDQEPPERYGRAVAAIRAMMARRRASIAWTKSRGPREDPAHAEADEIAFRAARPRRHATQGLVRLPRPVRRALAALIPGASPAPQGEPSQGEPAPSAP